MKRYDLTGQVRQFGAKQFWVVKLNSRFDAWPAMNFARIMKEGDVKIL